MRYSQIPKPKASYDDKDFLSIDDVIRKGTSRPQSTVSTLRRDAGGMPISGILLDSERPNDVKMIENESEILSLLMKASGQSQHVVPSFYEGGDDVYIENKKVTDVTVTTGDRRAIHTISNYYNTLGIYRDDFDKTNNDKLARNSYYAVCEKAMMDYMRSVQYAIKDSRNGDTIQSATEFFDCPNPQDSMGDIMSMLIRDITRYDAGVLVKTFNKAGFVVEMKPYLATEFWREQDRVPFIVNVPIMNTVDLTGGAYASHQQPTYQGWWSHGYTERFWQRSRTGVYIPFQPEEIAYFMMYPRTDGIYGTDFIKFLKYQIQYLIDSTKAAGKTFENGVVPSIVWEHPEVRTIPQLKQRIAELKYNNQGWQRFGSVIHTVNGEKVSSVAQSLHDMQWLDGQKFVAQLVWATWGFSQEEFLGGGENRATAYVKRNITKSRLLYPLMTFLEQRINREILPFLKGYRKYWKFSFTRDIELDDEQKVANTNSIKASTFLQYYSAGFPIEASMELAGLEKSSYKFNIQQLEAEIMQNQMMMLGQQPGEQGMESGGLENQEQGRYGAASEMYIGNETSEMGQGSAQAKNDPRDPAIDEQQYNKARSPEQQAKDQEERSKIKYEDWDIVPTGNVVHSVLGHEGKKPFKKGQEPALSNTEVGEKYKKEAEESSKGVGEMAFTLGKLAIMAAKKKKPEAGTLEKSTTINPANVAFNFLSGALGEHVRRSSEKERETKRSESEKKRNERKEPMSESDKEYKNTSPTRTTKETNATIKFPEDRPKKYSPPNEGNKAPAKQTRETKITPKPDTRIRVKPSDGTSNSGQNTVSATGQQQLPRNNGRTRPKITEEPLSSNAIKSLTIDKKDKREDMDYDPYWLAQGIIVEMEHTDDPEIAKEIAKDHLDEFPNYYQSLKKMENGMRKSYVEYYTDTQGIVKAKVYITHPSEAPKGRAVRRGNKGGYYYITNQRERGGAGAQSSGKQATKKKSSGGKGWGSSGGSEPSEHLEAPAPPPDIPDAEIQVKISGNGIGIVVGIIAGRLVASKLNTPQTAQFIKIIEKKVGENADAETIIQTMIITAEEMGLEISE